jgi:hypothetical protein
LEYYRLAVKMLTASLCRRLDRVQFERLLCWDRRGLQAELKRLLGFFDKRALEE